MDFVAIDVETANAGMDSICQIGIARFSGGELVDEWSSLIDPEDYFSPVNVSIHGIDPQMVSGAPTLPDVLPRLKHYLERGVVVCHTHFDRVALSQAFVKYGLYPIEAQWLDSARVVRRTWGEIAWSGYGLANVCRRIGYSFKHHDALEDAKAAGHVLITACAVSDQGIDYWLRRVEQPIIGATAYRTSIERNGNPEGDLYGEVLVFTGSLKMPRSQAAALAAQAGCEVADRVTKKTTMLVVGDQDIRKLAGHERSRKHRQAEELATKGQEIRILCETDFETLVSPAGNPESSVVMSTTL